VTPSTVAEPREPSMTRLSRLNPQSPTTRGVVASVLVVLMLALAGLIGWQAWQLTTTYNAGERDKAAVAAGRDFAQNLLSLNYSTVDRDIKRVVDRTTGDFKDQYTSGQATLKNSIVQTKSVNTAQILEAGLVSSDPDSAVVLVAAEGTSKSPQNPKGVLRHYRIQVSLSLQSGKWLVSDLKFVG
jgi:Mce-associated membrane protein